MLTFNCSQPISLSLSFPLFVPLLLSVNEIYMFTRYHGNFLFSPSRNYPRFILSTPTPPPPPPSARVFAIRGSLAVFGLVCTRRERASIGGWPTPVETVFDRKHLNDIFPFLTLLSRVIVLPRSRFECVFQYFFSLSFFSSSVHRSFQKFSIELTKYRQISSSVRRGKGVSSRG